MTPLKTYITLHSLQFQ